jgi:MFS superfamily sulfate permease-like transporter
MKDHIWLRANETQTWTTLALILITLFIMWALPKVKKFGIGHIIPASLAAIVVGTAIEWGVFRTVLEKQGGGTRTVGETALLEAGLPGFHFPMLPNGAKWGTIWIYAVSLALVGGVETVMTHEGEWVGGREGGREDVDVGGELGVGGRW